MREVDRAAAAELEAGAGPSVVAVIEAGHRRDGR